MGATAIEMGPVGHRVRTTIRRLRTHQRMTLREVAERMTERGRPIQINGISRIEKGERRVDVDDLVHFAEVLGVRPDQLLSDAPTQTGAHWESRDTYGHQAGFGACSLCGSSLLAADWITHADWHGSAQSVGGGAS